MNYSWSGNHGFSRPIDGPIFPLLPAGTDALNIHCRPPRVAVLHGYAESCPEEARFLLVPLFPGFALVAIFYAQESVRGWWSLCRCSKRSDGIRVGARTVIRQFC